MTAKEKDRVLVYSTDPKDQALISGVKDKQNAIAEQQKLVEDKRFVAVFRIETNSRGGKTVTVIDKLPAFDPFLKELTKELKMKCGTGGSYRIEGNFGIIEIQGDKRDAIKKLFEARSIKFKGM